VPKYRRRLPSIDKTIHQLWLGSWAAAGASRSQTRQQRCWLHKVRNVLDKVPEK